MRLCLIGDVHSNLEALNKSIEIIKEEKPDKVFFLGDLVGYGANPSECIKIARESFDVLIAGNHDYVAAGIQRCENFNPQATHAVNWTSEMLSFEEKFFLSSLPLIYEEKDIYLVHASLPKPEEWRYLFDIEEVENTAKYASGRLIFVGHSHIPMVIEITDEIIKHKLNPGQKLKKDRKYIINVGSIGQPRDGDPRICMVFYDEESGALEFQRHSYNIKTAQNKILDAGLPEMLALRLGFGK
ncbi:MAG: metallophosphoesterase family protein [bacterium]|nr:metallophosphoesterase family protein [bacterium]